MKKFGTLLLALVTALLISTAVWAAHSDHGCDSCHTPHHGDTLGGVPLWSGKASTATFTVYTSSSLNAAVGQPDGASKLCLACHDGTNPAYSWMAAERKIGTNLTTSHPVSFVYDSALASTDGFLKDPSAASSLGGTIAQDLLEGGKMQCSSCHDVHTSGIGENLLRGHDFTHGDPSLCRMCHVK